MYVTGLEVSVLAGDHPTSHVHKLLHQLFSVDAGGWVADVTHHGQHNAIDQNESFYVNIGYGLRRRVTHQKLTDDGEHLVLQHGQETATVHLAKIAGQLVIAAIVLL